MVKLRQVRSQDYSALAIRIAVLTAALGIVGCPPQVEVQKRQCDSSEIAHTAERWGGRLFIQARENVEWDRLIVPVVDWYSHPPLTFQELEDRFGKSLESSTDNDRPFAIYQIPEGRLELGTKVEKSGSAVHRARILSLRLEPPQHPSQALEASTYECAKELIPLARVLYVISNSNRTHVILELEDGLVRWWTWGRPEEPESKQ